MGSLILTPEALMRIPGLLAQGMSARGIAYTLGVTENSLKSTCSRYKISLASTRVREKTTAVPEHCTLEGATALCVRLEAYWKERGRLVTCTVVKTETAMGECWTVKSNISGRNE